MSIFKTVVIILLILLLAGLGVFYYFDKYRTNQRCATDKEELQKQIEDLKSAETNKTTTKERANSISSCASTLSDTQTLDIKLWKTYSNNTYKHSFKYPETWVVKTNENDFVVLTSDEANIDFQVRSDKMTATDYEGYTLDSKKEVKIACETAQVSYLSQGDNHIIAASFTKNNIPHIFMITYKDIGASMSGDIVDAYNLLLKTIAFSG